MLCVAFAVTATAQNNTVVNDKNAEVRNVTSFHAVEISHGIDLYITQGGTEGVAISASEEKYRSNIKTRVENGVLKIYYDDGGTMVHFTWGNRQMKAYVTVKSIDGLNASGGSDVYVQGMIQASNLSIDLSGGRDLNGQLQATLVKIVATGGSDVKISGKADKLSVEASGGSDFKGYDFITDNCDIDASGGSDVYISVNKEMNVKASGGSDVFYKGTAVINSTEASGGSGVKRRG